MSDLKKRLNEVVQKAWANGWWNGRVQHDVAEAVERIEELEAANTQWLDKWERQECSWCGTKQSLDVSEQEEKNLMEALLDRRDPLDRAGFCIFCEQRVGLSVFSNELLQPGRHLKGCAWLARRALGDNE